MSKPHSSGARPAPGSEDNAMDSLVDDVLIARSMGLSYGQYKAMMFDGGITPKICPVRSRGRKSRRSYTDEQAFKLWQEKYTDGQIGAALGVSRQAIQRWRDTMELPPVTGNDINTSEYKLIKTSRGIFAIRSEE